jgi:hypothetical protein
MSESQTGALGFGQLWEVAKAGGFTSGNRVRAPAMIEPAAISTAPMAAPFHAFRRRSGGIPRT